MNNLDQIEHIVVLMMENRSFDNVLGWLYENGESPKQVHPPIEAAEGQPESVKHYYLRSFNGLSDIDLQEFVNRAEFQSKTFALPPIRGASVSNVPDVAPLEYYYDVNEQLYGERDNPQFKAVAPMTGFLANFATAMTKHADGQIIGLSDEEQLERFPQIMETYTPAQLPVLNGLAKTYAVSDLWFASVPTQTNVNRAFLLCGNSNGGVDNSFHSPPYIEQEWLRKLLQFDQYKTKTMFNVLEDNKEKGIDWAVFYHDSFPPVPRNSKCFTRNAYTGLDEIDDVDDHFFEIEEFHRQARLGKLPSFSYVEPSWGFGHTDDDYGHQWLPTQKGNDYHPPRNMKLGEDLILSVYNSLVANRETWQKTLLVITFDEHVGAFDHVPPPWGATPPWGDNKPADVELQYGFEFDRFGVRIGTILVSPLISESQVFRSNTDVPFDHTSVPATVFKKFNISASDWKLGQRMEKAPTFESVIDRTKPRTDIFEARRVNDGEPIRTGDQVYLRNERTGDTISASPPELNLIRDNERYRNAATPLVGNTGKAPITLFTGIEERPILNGSTVQLASAQMSLEEKYIISGVVDEPQCTYDIRRYKDSKLQDWIVRKVGRSESDNEAIVCGDVVKFYNRLDGWLFQRKRFLNSSLDYEHDAWRIVSCPAFSESTAPMRFGDKVYLQCMINGDFVSVIDSGIQYYPTVANVAPVKIKIVGDTGPIESGDKIQLRTNESIAGKHNVLGAWMTENCYYYSGKHRSKQTWLIERRSGVTGALRFMEPIFLVNESWKQNLACNGEYLTTEKGRKYIWRFIAAE